MIFLRADPAANRRQIVIVADDRVGGDKIAVFDFLNKRRDINFDRTTLATGSVLALQATRRFPLRLHDWPFVPPCAATQNWKLSHKQLETIHS